ncbi:MAG: tagaturonate epimerase family protein [Anaerolineaceae bacterium]|nr:tagaturonate epimerase family protein [Anaerolineaceae bacterium]
MNTALSLKANTDLSLIPQSILRYRGLELGLANASGGKELVILASSNDVRLKRFEGEQSEFGEGKLLRGPLSSANAAALRELLPWLQPQVLGLKTSAGMGDRLGLATPGHVRATRMCQGKVAPIFAQQSIRELTRTGRTPQQVMDDAMWGVFQENWQEGFGADADHLKTESDIDACLAAGFTFFTIDPGEFVNDQADNLGLEDLKILAVDLPSALRMTENDLLESSHTIQGLNIYFSEAILLKAMVKYGHAVWHVVKMYQHLRNSSAGKPFELEVSVDETKSPTSHAEHYYIARELKRMGVQWVSLAPRFVGEFEKGVDYIGDLATFDADISGHAAIAKELGPYKISLHSGSDKFSIYPIAARRTRGLVHLKTAGTSYLEAIRTIAEIDPAFFKEIFKFCLGRYEQDKLSYHVSARLERAPGIQETLTPNDYLDNFDAREIIHVTFGSVLQEKTPDGTWRFYDRLMALLSQHPEVYANNLERHFVRHLKPFCLKSKPTTTKTK